MDKLREEIVSSTDVFNGRLLKVKVEEVRLADGSPARREVVYHPGAVAVAPINAAGHLMMVRQFRLPARRVLLEIPAGVLNEGEAPEECVGRELAEEIGMRPGRLTKLGAVYLAPGYSSELIHLYLAQDLSPAQAQADEDERLELVELPFAEALALIDRGEIHDAKTITGLLLAERKLR